MNVKCDTLLECLPPYQDQWITITKRQSVGDIIAEILQQHKEFAPFYDSIAMYFDGDSVEDICKNIYDFLKANIRYQEEKEDDQTTALPTGILTRRTGDCKHYASFSGGVLDALRRLTGRNIKWSYRFASYDLFRSTPGHVFVAVQDDERGSDEIWIDPTPGAADQIPAWIIDKKIKVSAMALRRNIAGVGRLAEQMVFVEEFPQSPAEALSPVAVEQIAEQQADEEVTPELQNAIEVLLHYGVMNEAGEVNDSLLVKLAPSLTMQEFEELANARQVLQVNIARAVTMGSVFSDIWRGVKKVTLAVPRNAYLSLLAINAFGMATKLYNAVFNADGSYWQPGQDRLYKFWYSWGGDWKNLENAIKSGHNKKAILGCADCEDSPSLSPSIYDEQSNSVGVVPALPGWVAVASALMAAIRPLLQDILKSRAAVNQMPANVDPNTGLPYGQNPGAYPGGSGGFDPLDWIKTHPLETVVIASGLWYFYTETKKPKRSA